MIEPYILAIQRAGFNLSTFVEVDKIAILNKSISELTNKDLEINDSVKVHFFSNILDVDAFSISVLIKYLKNNCKGINYFVCTSPKFPAPKNYRFELFVEEFQRDPGFQLLGYISEGKNEWRSDKTWTRLISVFKTVI